MTASRPGGWPTGIAVSSLAAGLGALPLFGLYHFLGDLVVGVVLRLPWPWNSSEPSEPWMILLAACLTVNAVVGMAGAIAVRRRGWDLVTSRRYRVVVLLLSCFDLLFLLAPGLAKWGAFWGQETPDLTFGPFPECDCAIADRVVNHLAGVWIEFQFILSIVAVVAAAITLALARRPGRWEARPPTAG